MMKLCFDTLLRTLSLNKMCACRGNNDLLAAVQRQDKKQDSLYKYSEGITNWNKTKDVKHLSVVVESLKELKASVTGWEAGQVQQ